MRFCTRRVARGGYYSIAAMTAGAYGPSPVRPWHLLADCLAALATRVADQLCRAELRVQAATGQVGA